MPDTPRPAQPPQPSSAADVTQLARCSAKGCRAAASVDLHWRNPRLHDAARVKHWLACDEHAESLARFLAARSFLLARVPYLP